MPLDAAAAGARLRSRPWRCSWRSLSPDRRRGRNSGADADLPDDLTPTETAEVVAVPAGDLLILSDGRTVRLAGIEAPKRVTGREGPEVRPLSDAARAALADRVLGRAVGLALADPPVDRWGRLRAHAVVADGRRWVQAALVEAGFARVAADPGSAAAARRLLALEAAARAARRGIWAEPFYALRRPIETPGYVDTFQIVEGEVREVSVARSGRIYLNFGADWRTDFTVAVDRQARPAFAGAGIDPAALAGRPVRVRGWIYAFDGPRIDLAAPWQIELPGPEESSALRP